jgi:hypothetical protein
LNLNTLFLRVVALVLPGLLASRIYRKLRGRPKRKDWEDYAEILFFSCAIYLLILVASETWAVWRDGWIGIQDTILGVFFTENKPLPYSQIGGGILLSFPIAFLAARVYRQNWINTLGVALRVTKRYGDDDLWAYFHDGSKGLVVVRDHKLDLMYYAYVQAYSESDTKRELWLATVTVYNGVGGQKLYETPSMYLCRGDEDLTIEWPKLGEEAANVAKD